MSDVSVRSQCCQDIVQDLPNQGDEADKLNIVLQAIRATTVDDEVGQMT